MLLYTKFTEPTSCWKLVLLLGLFNQLSSSYTTFQWVKIRKKRNSFICHDITTTEEYANQWPIQASLLPEAIEFKAVNKNMKLTPKFVCKMFALCDPV